MAETAQKIPKVHRSLVSKTEWGLVIGALLFIDIIQKILELVLVVVIGEVVNKIIDIVVGGSLILYLALRGELSNPDTRNRVLIAFLATCVAEAIPLLNVAAFWAIDGWYCMKQSVEANKKADVQETQIKSMQNKQNVEIQQNRMMRIQAIRERQEDQRQQTRIENQNQIQDSDELYEEAA
jgi:hypothetical protein